MEKNILDESDEKILDGLENSHLFLIARIVLILLTAFSLYQNIFLLNWDGFSNLLHMLVSMLKMILDVALVYYLIMHLKTEINTTGSKPTFAKNTIKIVLYYLGFKLIFYFFALLNLDFEADFKIMIMLAFIACTSLVFKREYDYFHWLKRKENSATH